ncbi:MAG: C1 family peptidase [Solirubrobacteraceae bacterium]
MSDTANLLGSVTGAPYSLGLVPTAQARASASATAAVKTAAASLPVSVDLTPDAMPVGNQGDVGSCAAWSTDYGALGYWENKEGIHGGGLEPMYTYAQVDGGGDNGSSIEANLNIDVQQGIDTQSDYWQGNFDFIDQPLAAETANAVNWKLTGYTNIAIAPSTTATVTQDSIEQALANGDPVVIGIPVYENFFYVTSANNGYYSTISGALAGYHAIVALGYNSNGLVIENSWGTSWGDSGYATLAWSFVNQYVFDADAVGALRTGQPLSSSAPALSGSAAEAQTLTATHGSWSPAATSYTYNWERAASGSSDWSAIAGASNATYLTGAADLGNDVRVLVTATNPTGSGASASAAVGPITSSSPSNSAPPAVTGSLRPGQTLTATTGTWSGAPTSYAYQWQRATGNGANWTPIANATSSTYLEATADVSASLRVAVTATNSYGFSAAYSAAVGPVLSGAPSNTAAPVVTGTQREGSTLSASAGTWSPAASSYAYQWQRSANGGSTWASISGATGTTYVLESPDVGALVRVQVTATNSNGQGIASTQVGPIASDAPASSALPAISGTAKQGQTLKTTNGTWSPAATSYSYQWQRSSNKGTSWSAIAGATGATYVTASADLAASLRVVLTAINSYGQVSASSAAFGPIGSAAPASTALPAISGTAKQGQTLKTTNGTWNPAATSYSYQWQRSSNKGTSWSSIARASDASYTLASADLADEVRVAVTASNQYGESTADSAPSAAVTPAASATARRTPSPTQVRLRRVTVARAAVVARATATSAPKMRIGVL